MSIFASIFSDFNLPNATTWFYFSLLLGVALFFKFTRLLSVRNWDILTLFLLVPGLLLLQEARTPLPLESRDLPLAAARLVAGTGQAALAPAPGLAHAATLASAASPLWTWRIGLLWLGYLWLLCGSAFLLARCFFDLALVRRPALNPNLNLSGLAWLGVALFVCLVAVAVRGPVNPPGMVGKRSAVVTETQRRAENFVQQEIPGPARTGLNARFWVGCISAVLCHLAIVVGLVVIGWRHFQDAHSGVAAATFYLLLPYTAYHVDQVHHVLPTALLVWAVAAYRRPTLAGVLFGLAFGAAYFPVLMLPAWLSFYWRRGAGRFAGAFVLAGGLCLAAIICLLWVQGDLPRSVHSTLSLSDWQAWKQPNPETTQGFWTGVSRAWPYRMPVFIAYLAFVIATLFWPAPKNLANLIALSAAVVIGIQYWFADQGGVYILWYLPFLLLLVFRPNLADRFALPIAAETDWLRRLGRRLARWVGRVVRVPQPLARVH